MRKKQMTYDEFEKIAELRWVPASWADSSWPSWMRNISREKVELVLVSGSFIGPRVVMEEGVTISGSVGGIDVYRNDPYDALLGYPYNKDHYVVVVDRATSCALFVWGPYKDHEHWIKELPDLSPSITIIER